MSALALLVAAASLAGGLLWRRHCLSLVAQAGHELRGPLQTALLGLHGLGGDGARLAAIDLELRRAVRAVEDLTAAAGGRRAPDAPARVELGELLEEGAAAWELLAAPRGVALVVVPPSRSLAVRADRLRLAQAVANLVANAVEHGGGAVQVRVREAAGHAGVEVTDGGPGLPVPLAELVAGARGRRGRRGHGLALASAIAVRHGGRLVTAPSPRGARLVLELPLADSPAATGRRGVRARHPFRARRPGAPARHGRRAAPAWPRPSLVAHLRAAGTRLRRRGAAPPGRSQPRQRAVRGA